MLKTLQVLGLVSATLIGVSVTIGFNHAVSLLHKVMILSGGPHAF